MFSFNTGMTPLFVLARFDGVDGNGDSIQDCIPGKWVHGVAIGEYVAVHSRMILRDSEPCSIHPVTPAVRQTDNTWHDFLGDMDGHLEFPGFGGYVRGFAFLQVVVFGIHGIDVEEAALAARRQTFEIVHPRVVGSDISSADQQDLGRL